MYETFHREIFEQHLYTNKKIALYYLIQLFHYSLQASSNEIHFLHFSNNHFY